PEPPLLFFLADRSPHCIAFCFIRALANDLHLTGGQGVQQGCVDPDQRRGFFPLVHHGGRADLQHPHGVSDTTTMETHGNDVLVDGGQTSFGRERKLQGIPRAVRRRALGALLTRRGLPTCDDVVTVTVGTAHGHADHEPLLLTKLSAWHPEWHSAHL